MKIKVCGITSLQQLKDLQYLHVDYAGLIFYPPSLRFVGDKLKDDMDAVAKLAIKKVGVFVNASLNDILHAIETYHLYAVQLHGEETPELCAALQPHAKVIKAIRIGNDANALKRNIETYKDCCAYFLFDTDTKNYGGSGQSFDWNILQHNPIEKPFFLSGGIGPDDVQKLKNFHHAQLFAIDVNSRFESSPGIKSMGFLKSFVTALNEKI